MIELPLTRDAEEWGRAEKRRRDRAGLTDMFRRAGRDKRWTGFAVEYELHAFLRDNEIPHVWNGGVDSKADFIIGGEDGIGVAVKSNNGPGPQEDFTFLVSINRFSQLSDGVLLAVVNTSLKRIWIAGYITADRFRQLARRRKKGDTPEFVGARPLDYSAFTIRADQLEPPERFFELMRRTAA